MTFTDAELDAAVFELAHGHPDDVDMRYTAAAIEHLRDRIEAAVKAERERCAKVANKLLVSSTFGNDSPTRVVYSGHVAAAIMEEPK